VITRHGLLAAGVKPNPFVSPASYMCHSNTATEEGQLHLERMCRQWTLRQIEKAIEEEQRIPSHLDPHKPRVGTSTPLSALLLEMEKGRLPSDLQESATAPGAIGTHVYFNVTAEPPKKITERLRRSPKAAIKSPFLLGAPAPPSNKMCGMAWRAKFALGEQVDGVEWSNSDADDDSESEASAESTEEHYLRASLATAKERLLAEQMRLSTRNRRDRGQFSSRVQHRAMQATASPPLPAGWRAPEHASNAPTSPSLRSSSLDEAWLDAKIARTVAGLMHDRSIQEERLTQVLERANAAIELLVDQRDLRAQRKDVETVEHTIRHLVGETNHTTARHQSTPEVTTSVTNEGWTPVAQLTRQQHLSEMRRRQEAQLAKEIAHLDAHLEDIQSLISSEDCGVWGDDDSSSIPASSPSAKAKELASRNRKAPVDSQDCEESKGAEEDERATKAIIEGLKSQIASLERKFPQKGRSSTNSSVVGYESETKDSEDPAGSVLDMTSTVRTKTVSPVASAVRDIITELSSPRAR